MLVGESPLRETRPRLVIPERFLFQICTLRNFMFSTLHSAAAEERGACLGRDLQRSMISALNLKVFNVFPIR